MEHPDNSSSASLWSALTKPPPEEKGMFKFATQKLRFVGTATDLVPIPVLGEVTAVAATALAGGIDVVGKLLQMDFKAAAEELAVSAAETAMVAAPFLEYAMVATYSLSGGKINPRERARHIASTVFCKACGMESRLFNADSVETAQTREATLEMPQPA